MMRWLRLIPAVSELEARAMTAEAREQAANERLAAVQAELFAVNRRMGDWLAKQIGAEREPEQPGMKQGAPPSRQAYELAARADAEFMGAFRQ